MIPNKLPQTNTLTIAGCEEPLFVGAILPQWSDMAAEKGFPSRAGLPTGFTLRCVATPVAA